MGYNNSWDPTTSITTYFTQLDCFQVSLGNRGIATRKAKKTMVAGAQMWQSEMFTEDQMVAWENKPAAQQTWAALLTYFTKEWLERKQYSTTMAKQSRFKEAALLAQETAAAKEEGESQAVLFATLQEQHDKQIVAMTATNKANMDAMMERMNAILAGGREKQTAQHDKDNPPPGRNRRPLAGTGMGTDQTKQPRKQMARCHHCKKFVLYKPDNCTELKANNDNVGWAGSLFMPLPDKHRGRLQ
jgi:hypothetical protein